MSDVQVRKYSEPTTALLHTVSIIEPCSLEIDRLHVLQKDDIVDLEYGLFRSHLFARLEAGMLSWLALTCARVEAGQSTFICDCSHLSTSHNYGALQDPRLRVPEIRMVFELFTYEMLVGRVKPLPEIAHMMRCHYLIQSAYLCDAYRAVRLHMGAHGCTS